MKITNLEAEKEPLLLKELTTCASGRVTKNRSVDTDVKKRV
jgi:hypothetical protein